MKASPAFPLLDAREPRLRAELEERDFDPVDFARLGAFALLLVGFLAISRSPSNESCPLNSRGERCIRAGNAGQSITSFAPMPQTSDVRI